MEEEEKSGDHHADNKKAEEKLDIFNKSFVCAWEWALSYMMCT